MGWRAGWAAGGLVLALSGGVLAQEPPVPTEDGWYLEEFDSGINDLYLVWYDVAAEKPLLQLHCVEKWPDVSITAFIDAPENDPTELAIVAGDLRHAMEPISGPGNGLYSSGGTAQFTPEVMDILTGQFSVEVDGVEWRRFSTKGATEAFERLFDACPVDGDGS